MKSRLLLIVLAAFSLWLAVSAAGSASTGTTVGVSEREWHITLGRLKAPHGTVTFSVTNFGADPHNIEIRRHGIHYGSTGRIEPGHHAELTAKLTPGVYIVMCSLPGHAALGMVAKLTVT